MLGTALFTSAGAGRQDIGLLQCTEPAYIAHPEHAYTGIAPGPTRCAGSGNKPTRNASSPTSQKLPVQRGTDGHARAVGDNGACEPRRRKGAKAKRRIRTHFGYRSPGQRLLVG